MDFALTNFAGTPLLAIPGDAVAHLGEPGQGLDVHVDQIAGPLPLVPLHRWLGLQVSSLPQSETAGEAGDGGEGSPQKPGDVPVVQPLVAAHAASIRQKGSTALAIPGQPAVGAAQADAALSSQLGEAAAVLQVLGQKLEPPPLGVGVGGSHLNPWRPHTPLSAGITWWHYT
jgi:hypothetical protein